MLALIAFASMFGATASALSPAPKDMVSTFASYCLETKADRAAFDLKVNQSTGLEKLSSPSLFSSLEFHRRWKAGGVELSFTDAPPPTPRSCAVTASAQGGFDGQVVVAELSKVSGTVMQQAAANRWVGMMPTGENILVNNRPNPDGFGDIEIILMP